MSTHHRPLPGRTALTGSRGRLFGAHPSGLVGGLPVGGFGVAGGGHRRGVIDPGIPTSVDCLGR